MVGGPKRGWSQTGISVNKRLARTNQLGTSMVPCMCLGEEDVQSLYEGSSEWFAVPIWRPTVYNSGREFFFLRIHSWGCTRTHTYHSQKQDHPEFHRSIPPLRLTVMNEAQEKILQLWSHNTIIAKWVFIHERDPNIPKLWKIRETPECKVMVSQLTLPPKDPSTGG